jgi:peptidoglycan/LPS O-acetylase OafA/YrhL
MFFVIIRALITFAGTGNAYFIICNALLAYTVLYISFVPSGRIRAFNRIGDYSYGMYIYAFPVQQSLAASVPGLDAKAMFFSSFAITFLFAFLSWHVIEKQMLKKKGTYVYVQEVLSRRRFAKQSV